jgi:1-deoxy-D-xylulose 5-phosphate reductoisomerase
VVEETLNRVKGRRAQSIGEVLEIDRDSREVARALIRERAAGGPAVAPVPAFLTQTLA